MFCKANIRLSRLLAGLLLAGVLFGVNAAEEISSVVFQQKSDYKFDEDILRANVQSRKGGVYSERTVNDDIKRLHAMGVFADVVSETRNTADGKKQIVFSLVPKPVVKEIKFEGNKKYSEKKLKEEIKLSVNVPLNDSMLRSSIDSLRKFYRSKGLNDAVIQSVFEKIDNSHIRVLFKIKENLRLRVGNVLSARATGKMRKFTNNRNSVIPYPIRNPS